MDKTKIFESAGKLASKGQLEKAAKELQRILDADPKDIRALQKLAEIHQKSNRPKEATELLLKVAQGYTEQGFFLKAVSVYKQVLKLGEDRLEIHLRLAQLYQQLGLIGEATQQYQLVANQQDQSGNVKESLSALKRMVDLDPDNVANRVKLGELYARERMVPEAVQELDKAAAHLKKNQRSEDHLRVLERISQLVPDDGAVARELAQSYLARKDPRRALNKLQVCFRHDPKDPQTLSLLAAAFTDNGQPAKTVSVLRELARVHEEKGAREARREVLTRILLLAPGDPEATEALASLEPVLVPAAALSGGGTAPGKAIVLPAFVLPPDGSPRVTPSPVARPVLTPSPIAPLILTPSPMAPPILTPSPVGSPLVVPPAPARAAPPPAAEPESVDKLVIETDVFLKFRLVPKAAEHIARALALDPASLPANERLLTIYDRQEKPSEAIALLERMVELAHAAGDREREQQYAGDLARRAPDHPALAAAGPDDPIIEPDEMESAAALLADEALDDDAEFEIHTGSTIPPGAESQAALPAEAARDDDAGFEIHTGSTIPPGAESAPALPADEARDDDAGFEIHTGSTIPPSAESAPALPADEAQDDDVGFEIHTGSTIPPSAESAQAHPVLTPWDDDDLKEEAVVLDNAAPRPPAARPSIDLDDDEVDRALDRATGPHRTEPRPEPIRPDPFALFDQRPSSPSPPAPRPTGPAPTRSVAADQQASRKPQAVPPGDGPQAPGADSFEEDLAEIEFLIQQGLRDDARESLAQVLAQAPTHPRALALEKSLAGGPPAGEPGGRAAHPTPSESDLADELEGAFEAIAAKAASEAAPSTLEGSSLATRAPASRRARAGGEVEGAYDLGIAYFEMGRFDAAIEQLEAALQDRRRTIDALIALGLCQRERGDLAAAVDRFERALKTPGLTLDASKAVHYELGACAEELEQLPAAFDHFSRIVRADPAFRDAQARAQRLRPLVSGTGGESKPVHPVPATDRALAPPARPPREAPPAAVPRKGRKIGFL